MAETAKGEKAARKGYVRPPAPASLLVQTMHERSTLKAQALQGLLGLRGSIQLDVVARWGQCETKVGDMHLDPQEYRTFLAGAGRHDESGYAVESRFLMDEILSRVGILCRTGLPPRHQIYVRPRSTRIRIQDRHGRHRAIAEAWLAHHQGGLCLHVGAGPHMMVDGPGAAAFLHSLHNAASGRSARVELWDDNTLDAGQAVQVCHLLESVGLQVPSR